MKKQVKLSRKEREFIVSALDDRVKALVTWNSYVDSKQSRKSLEFLKTLVKKMDIVDQD